MLALKGDERLSGTSKADGGGGHPERKSRKDRAGTIGRALRNVYDDMLREDIPDDFLNLLKKLD